MLPTSSWSELFFLSGSSGLVDGDSKNDMNACLLSSLRPFFIMGEVIIIYYSMLIYIQSIKGIPTNLVSESFSLKALTLTTIFRCA